MTASKNSGAACAGLIEAQCPSFRFPSSILNSGAACAGLIEATGTKTKKIKNSKRIPAQPAPASLKPEHQKKDYLERIKNSGAACAGLIEADDWLIRQSTEDQEFRRSLRRPH